jgi:predicted nucleic-acid-binding protein
MIAVDTNVLVRLLLRDDEPQYRRVLKLFGEARDYTAPPTVMLELVWVLESSGCSRVEIAASLRSLLGMRNFRPRNAAAIHAAANWYESGTDFADALHLAMSASDDAFMTFDARLAKRMQQQDVAAKVVLL